MTRRNGRPIHAAALKPSMPDTIALGAEVDERFVRLLDQWLQKRGERLVPPRDMNHDLLLWRTLRVRHKQGDLRNSEAELKALRAVAQWTLDMDNMLFGFPAGKPIEWQD